MTRNSKSEVRPALVAVDFTSTDLRLLLSTPEKQLIANEQYQLPTLDDEEAWAWEVGGRLSTLFSRDGEPLFALGIAIACPGMVHPIRGVLTESRAQEGWNELHVVDAIRRHINAPTVAIDRVQAGLRGEMTAGAAIDATDVLYVSVRESTIVAAILSSGTIIRGAHHRSGRRNSTDDAREIATIAAALDSALVILDTVNENADEIESRTRNELKKVRAGGEVIISKLGTRAPLLGALEAAAIVAYEGQHTIENDNQ